MIHLIMKKSIFKILFVVAVLVGISIPNNVAAQQNVVDNDSLSIIRFNKILTININNDDDAKIINGIL